MDAFLKALLPALVVGVGGGAAVDVTPVTMGAGGLWGTLLAIGLAYAQSQAKKPKKRK